MLSMNYIKEEQNYYEQKIKELTEKDEYNIRRSQRQQKEIERLKSNYEKIYNENCKLREQHNITDISLLDENERLNNIINEILEMVCCIEHNLDKYEEIGGDHLEYATNKVYELKEYIIEELKEGKE